MDPLSITASTLTLIQAAGYITTTLGNFVRGLRTVDTRIAGLCEEVCTLKVFLEAVDDSLKDCGKFDLGHLDKRLWQQSEIALENCQTTLSELTSLVNKIEESSRSRRFGWKARVVVDLKIYHDDVAAYREKIRQSNLALQTMFHAITVSLSLRHNVSQELILLQLDRLEASICKALHASSTSSSTRVRLKMDDGRPDSYITRNLRKLAEAADEFRATASSTASTVRSDDSVAPAPWQSCSGSQLRLNEDCPALFRRERVEEFLASNIAASPRAYVGQPAFSPRPSYRLSSSTIYPASQDASLDATMVAMDDDEDADAELDRALMDGLMELAAESIKRTNYTKAIAFLRQALAHETGTIRRRADPRSVEVQLALCYILQGSWRVAEPIVKKLAKKRADQDLVVCSLLHALALGFLSDYSFDSALDACKLALCGKRRLCLSGNTDWKEYSETLGLLATIFEVMGDYVRAEVFRSKLSSKFEYSHPISPAAFIQSKVELLPSLLCAGPTIYPEATGAQIAELDGAARDVGRGEETRAYFRGFGVASEGTSSLPAKVSRYEKYDLDTAKEVVFIDVVSGDDADDADDEISPISASPESPLRRQFSRFFGNARHRSPKFEQHNHTSGSDSELPSSSSSPATAFPKRLPRLIGNNIFRSKKPRILSKKKTQGKGLFRVLPSRSFAPDSSFSLLHMERVGTPETPQLSRQFSWSRERCRYYTPESIGCNGVSDEAASSRTRNQVTSESPEGGECAVSYNFQYQHRVAAAELDDTGISQRQVMQRRQGYGRISSQAHKAPQGHGETSFGSTLSSEDGQDSTLQLDALEAKVLIDVLKLESLSETSGKGPESKERPKINTNTKREGILCPHEACLYSSASVKGARDSLEHRCRVTTPKYTVLSAEQQQLIREWSSAVSSLSGLKDGKSLREKEQELFALVPQLKAISTDTTMLQDTLRIIRSLGSKIISAERHDSDSGYASTASSDRLDTAGLQSIDKGREGPVRQTVEPRHSPSWSEGPDDIYLATPAREP